MKYNPKTNKVKLEPGERRIGNYFFKKEGEHFKLQDLNSVFSFRAWSRMPIGIWLSNMYKMGSEADSTIKTYVAVMWSLFSVVPDDQFISELLSSTEAALKRHPDWYGYKLDATEEDDAEALNEVREMKEFEGEIAKISEDGGEEIRS